jgi:FKBP-type peptidyl-prolyl cis-trans isomerase (trigger factor)
MADKNYSIKNKNEEKKELTLEVEIQKDFVDSFKEKALKKVSENIEIKGFRKGAAPEKMVVEKVGEMAIMEEQAYRALNNIIPQIISDEKIDSISTPKINITKISPSDNLELKVSFTLMPDVELADYKKIAKDVKVDDAPKVEEKEIDDYIEYIRKNRAEAIYMHKKTNGEEVDEKEKENLPELNDEFVKTLGDFKDVEDFKNKLRENLQKEKETKNIQKRRMEIIEKIISESKTDLPDILVDEEVDRMARQFRAEIEGMKINFDDYLKQLKKTDEDLRKEWRTDAIKRTKMNLILPKIAKEEEIKFDQKRFDKELEHLISHHKEIDPEQAKIYLMHALTNEAVFEYLEKIK